MEKGDWVFLGNSETYIITPFLGLWTVKERRGVNVHFMNNDSNENGINKWVHLNRCKKVPQFIGEGVSGIHTVSQKMANK